MGLSLKRGDLSPFLRCLSPLKQRSQTTFFQLLYVCVCVCVCVYPILHSSPQV